MNVKKKLKTIKQTVRHTFNVEPLYIRVVETSVTPTQSKRTGFKYDELRIHYQLVTDGDESKIQFYRAAAFSHSGKAILKADMKVGDSYRVERNLNDQEFIDWVSVELVSEPTKVIGNYVNEASSNN